MEQNLETNNTKREIRHFLLPASSYPPSQHQSAPGWSPALERVPLSGKQKAESLISFPSLWGHHTENLPRLHLTKRPTKLRYMETYGNKKTEATSISHAAGMTMVPSDLLHSQPQKAF